MLCIVNNIMDSVGSMFENPVLNFIIIYIVGTAIDISCIAGFAVIAIWMPYFILYILSPKKFWIEGNTVVHKFRLLGIIGPTRRIHFDKIRNIEVSESVNKHHLIVRYELKLPIWIRFFVEFWTDKTPQWFLTLANDVDDRQMANAIADELMEAITTNPMRAEGGANTQH